MRVYKNKNRATHKNLYQKEAGLSTEFSQELTQSIEKVEKENDTR
ncbi:hypothetical protein SDC9_195199 [bioreactor metagenome]|uniref:Uncharacterized protein n=1 Tax=bioreactor metagenome TaxID=1076179 RepID=A0A645I9L7_9ZZZZ